jgi:hypothetical protein
VSPRDGHPPLPRLSHLVASNSRGHFTSDVVAGAFIGTAISRFLVKRHNDEKAGVLSKTHLDVVPIRRGVAARLRF